MELFPTTGSEQEDLTRLIECLQARIGRDQVQRLIALRDHRPEQSNVWVAADAQMRQARAARVRRQQGWPRGRVRSSRPAR
jgi:protein ImuB